MLFSPNVFLHFQRLPLLLSNGIVQTVMSAQPITICCWVNVHKGASIYLLREEGRSSGGTSCSFDMLA